MAKRIVILGAGESGAGAAVLAQKQGLDTFDNTRMMLFNENRVYANLLKEKKFEFFANSFFIEVTK